MELFGDKVIWHSGLQSKPLEVDLDGITPIRLRIYIYNATYPPGGRSLGERKIQLIVPGQPRGCRGNFDHSDGRMVFLVGYESDVEVFILWDAGTYKDFPYSGNVQIYPDAIFEAFSGKIALRTRSRRTPRPVNEVVICCPKHLLLNAISERIRLSLERLLEG